VETLTPPYLLLAAPVLSDPNFERTVVLMGHHSEEGAVGWVVNRLVDGGARALLPDEVSRTIHPDTPLRIGGPVATPGLIVVHRETFDGIESIDMAPGLRVSATPAVLPHVFAEAPDNAPVCGLLVFGYSGWGPGQLEHEMEEGSWLVLPYDPAFAFPADVAGLWERALAELGVRPDNVSTPPGGVN
jgi:putative transcriptional regulator